MTGVGDENSVEVVQPSVTTQVEVSEDQVFKTGTVAVAIGVGCNEAGVGVEEVVFEEVDSEELDDFVEEEKPDLVILCQVLVFEPEFEFDLLLPEVVDPLLLLFDPSSSSSSFP